MWSLGGFSYDIFKFKQVLYEHVKLNGLKISVTGLQILKS